MRWSWLIALLAPCAAWALNGAAEIGVGAKSKGMGGVGIALPQDAFVAALNPAGLYCVGNSIDVGLGYTFQEGLSRHYDRDTNATLSIFTNKSEGVWFPELAASWRFCRSQAVGFAAYVRGALSTKYDAQLFEWDFNSSPSRFDAYTIFLTPSWAWQINRCLAFGLAVNGVVQLHRNNVQFTEANGSVLPNRPQGYFVGPDTLDVSGGANVRVGLLYSVSGRFHVGITYQTPALMSKLNDYNGQWPRTGFWDWPADLGLGAALHFCKGWVVSVDWNYLFWNDTITWGNPYRGLTGQAVGPGFGWVDRTVWKLGLAWTPSCLPCVTVRIGYNYGTPPVLGDDVYLNQLTLATIAHHITAGASARFGCGEFSIYYYHGFRNTVRGVGRLSVNSSATERADLRNTQNGVGISYGVDW